MPNQWKPTPPPDILEPHARKYWMQGMSRKQILVRLRDHYDTNLFGLGETKLKSLCKEWGLVGTRQQAHSLETIAAPIAELRKRFPNAGAQELRKLLLHEFDGMKVPRLLVLRYLNATERQAVIQRKGRRFKRKRYYAAGLNHVWSFDQHDKWKRFGLYFHVGVEPFSGKILWLKVWWGNSNPRLICGYFIEAARKFNGIPLLTQSDLGSENFGIANAQTSMRQFLDETLIGTLQHRWMRSHNNIKPEIEWSQFRLRWVPGFEALFDQGVDAGWYDTVNTMHRLVFLWLAIPWIQREVDAYVYRHNATAKRADRNKILPHGVPDDIFDHPERYGGIDYKINVPPEVLLSAEEQWAPRDHPVFNLVDPCFQEYIMQHYLSIGSPIVNFDSFWQVYRDLLTACQERLDEDGDEGLRIFLNAQAAAPEAGENQGIPLMAGEAPQFGENGIPAVRVYDLQADEPLNQFDTVHNTAEQEVSLYDIYKMQEDIREEIEVNTAISLDEEVEAEFTDEEDLDEVW